MWAIYQINLIPVKITLHRLKPKVDSGNIIYSNRLKITKNTKLHELRYLNFKKACEQAIKFINLIFKKKKIKDKKLKKLGKYYSFMPSNLKTVCVKNFNEYKKTKI